MQRAVLLVVSGVLVVLSAGRSAAQPHSPAEVKNPPAPVVGRNAELLPDHGGPVLELFRLKLPERPWLSDGVTLGRSTLRLGFAYEGGWQSSALLYAPWGHRDTEQSTPVLRLVSQVRLASTKPLRTGSVSVRYGVDAAVGSRQQLARMHDADPHRDLLDAWASGRLELDIRRRAILGLEANFVRVNQQIWGAPGVSEVDYFDSRLRLRIPLRENRMSFDVLYRFAMWQPERAEFKDLRQREQNLQLRLEWRFPFKWRAGFLLEAGYVSFRSWPILVSPIRLIERRAIPLRTTVELSGIIGPRLSFTLGIGYGVAVLQWPDARPATLRLHHGVVAHLGLAIRLAKGLVLSLGLWSDFRAETGISEVVTVDNYVLTLTALPWRRLSVQLTAAYVSRRYKWDHVAAQDSQYGFLLPAGVRLADRPFTDPNLLVRSVVDWYAMRWLSVGASYQFQASFTDGPIAIPNGLDPSARLFTFRYPYRQHRVLARIALRY